jgi:phospholipid/cholesterol/gamma-HCH transport system substrate-binding protein
MAKSLNWNKLVPGILAFAAITAVALAILIFGRPGALHGRTTRLYVATSAARGILPGSDVWLEGQRIGMVKTVKFRPATVDTSRRLIIVTEILARHLPQLRSDSYAQIRNAGSLIGAPVVYLTSGTPTAGAIRAKDTIQAKPQGDFEGVTSQVALATRHFPAIIENVKALRTQMGSARGTLGAAMSDDGTEQLDILKTNASRIAHRAFESNGTIALTFREGNMMARASRAIAAADSIRALLDSPNTSFGRFQRDSTLMRTVGSVRNEISIIRARLDNAEGTAGRVLGDSAVFQQLARLERDLGALMDDIKRHPLRYVAF